MDGIKRMYSVDMFRNVAGGVLYQGYNFLVPIAWYAKLGKQINRISMVPYTNSTKLSRIPMRYTIDLLVFIGFQQPLHLKFHRTFVFLGAFSTPRIKKTAIKRSISCFTHMA